MTPAQLRWILLIIGVLFLGALAWWERRRPRQAVGGSGERGHAQAAAGEGNARARSEPPLTLPTMRAREPEPPHELPVFESGAEGAGDAPTDEVAALKAAEPPAPERPAIIEESFEYVPKADAPAAMTPAPPAAAAAREVLPELPAGVTPRVEWPPDDQRSIVAVRLIAPIPERFAGRSLRQALAAEGFVLGRFAIFHKPDESHRAVLSAASLTRPGTFDADTMDSQHFGGLSLFAVLPGPKPPPQAFDELVFTARSLNERLHGVLQDEQGSPLTPSRVALLRERLNSGPSL
jgi:cell division protein ZipA